MNHSTPSFLKRCASNPILDATKIPYDASLIFNAGVTRYQGKYIMTFRNDYGSSETDWKDHYSGKIVGANQLHTTIGIAFSDDGVNWEPRSKPVFELSDDEIIRAYDPRLTTIDGQIAMCFAVDTRHGLRGGIALTDDFEKFKIMSLSTPDNRNLVLFPEKFQGKYLRLERPMPIYSRGAGEHFDIWCSYSPNLHYWGNSQLLLGAEKVPFANAKIGPAAPPIKTPKGWLTTFHAVQFVQEELYAWHPDWHKVYSAGLMLLDLEDPTKIIGMGKSPLLWPETDYELRGFRGGVVFPGGMILEDSGEVKIYYGAADTVECLAVADVGDLIAFCEPIIA